MNITIIKVRVIDTIRVVINTIVIYLYPLLNLDIFIAKKHSYYLFRVYLMIMAKFVMISAFMDIYFLKYFTFSFVAIDFD